MVGPGIRTQDVSDENRRLTALSYPDNLALFALCYINFLKEFGEKVIDKNCLRIQKTKVLEKRKFRPAGLF